MKRFRKSMGLFLIAVLCLGVFEACSSAENANAPTPATQENTDDTQSIEKQKWDLSKQVEISYLVINDEPTGYQTMLSAFNEKVKADLNATLKLNFVGVADGTSKYALILASGEPVDMAYVGTWADFYGLAQKGAFKAIEELIPEYAPESWAQMDNLARIQCTVNNHIYSVPQTREDYSAYGVALRKDFVEKYSIPEVTDLKSYGVYLKTIKENEPTIQPTNLYSYGSIFDTVFYQSEGLYTIAGGGLFMIDPTEKNPKVISNADYDGTLGFLQMMKEWFDAGYWPASALSNQDSKMLETGKSASDVNNIDHWAGWSSESTYDFSFTEITHNIQVLSKMQDGVSIPSSAANPERALMLLNRIRSDRDYFDLFTYGVPGVQSNIQADGSVIAVDPQSFPLDPTSWGMRTQEFYRPNAGLPDDYQKNKDSFKKNIVPNKYRSCVISFDAVKNEYAAVQNVIAQYWEPLKFGYIADPAAGLEELKVQLKAAGSEKVIAELQRQVDEFNAMWPDA